ncbi:hypothetical protein [Rhodococcus artemisiae]|uniref:Uncharacterized protein n=1 Tax=Rhodococcus artemisiae TaxID=714159 RepID=A0ABU7LAE6_9NOCA|nr:hypothetical protein [Rhodococcus artemisiae]MEE2058516.1 hypothetical protein [Rhodococcus artemisiae]
MRELQHDVAVFDEAHRCNDAVRGLPDQDAIVRLDGAALTEQTDEEARERGSAR